MVQKAAICHYGKATPYFFLLAKIRIDRSNSTALGSLFKGSPRTPLDSHLTMPSNVKKNAPEMLGSVHGGGPETLPERCQPLALGLRHRHSLSADAASGRRSVERRGPSSATACCQDTASATTNRACRSVVRPWCLRRPGKGSSRPVRDSGTPRAAGGVGLRTAFADDVPGPVPTPSGVPRWGI